MNLRSQSTPGGAFSRAKDVLTAKVMARYLGVTEWTIYDRCDAPEFKNLNLSAEQMLELDTMCRSKSGETPLRDWYNDYLDATPRSEQPSLEIAAIELARDVGEVEGEVLSIRGSKLSNRKVIDIQNCLAKVKRDVDSIEEIVEKAGGAA